MPTRTAEAEWNGDLMQGTGHLKTGSGALDSAYDWRGRSGDGAGTNPEELLGAAHAGCYSMQLSALLGMAGHPPTKIHTVAKVTLDKAGEGFAITKIELTTDVEAPGISQEAFETATQTAKSGCPVSKALAGTEIHLTANLH